MNIGGGLAKVLFRNAENRRQPLANLGLVFLAFAFVFACLYAFGMKAIGRADMLGLILAFWIASELIGGLPRLFH